MSDIMNIATMPFFNTMSAEESKMDKLMKFFRYRYHLDILREFISPENRRNKLSLRLVNWFVTNYAKQFDTIYSIKKPNGKIKQFFVWTQYTSELDSQGKRYFDPFRRGRSEGKVFSLEYEEGKELKTTLAQMNFFKWAIQNGVVDYVKKHIESIYNDMQTRDSGKSKDINNKKRQLSVSASRTLGFHTIHTKN